MNQRKKRKPDFRRIGPSRTYSIPELAEAVQRTPATVRNWLRQGMPTLDDSKPKVIDGAQAKEWLKQKWESRKMPTLHGQARCFGCKQSRPFAKGTRFLKRTSAKVLTITGKCAVCGRTMNQFASAKSVSLIHTENESKRANSAA